MKEASVHFPLRCFVTEKKTVLSAPSLRLTLSAPQNSSVLLGFRPQRPCSACSLWAETREPRLRPKQEGRFRTESENRMFFLVCVCVVWVTANRQSDGQAVTTFTHTETHTRPRISGSYVVLGGMSKNISVFFKFILLSRCMSFFF